MSNTTWLLPHTRRGADSASALLRAKGIEPTTLRLIISEILLSRVQHWTLSQIRHHLKHANCMISNLALQNTLRLLSTRNVVREITIDANTVFYDSDTRTHYHFYNRHTGDLVDIPTMDISIFETAQAVSDLR